MKKLLLLFILSVSFAPAAYAQETVVNPALAQNAAQEPPSRSEATKNTQTLIALLIIFIGAGGLVAHSKKYSGLD